MKFTASKRRRSNGGRYILSIIILAVMVSGLVVGSVGSFLQITEAQSNDRRGGSSRWERNDRNERGGRGDRNERSDRNRQNDNDQRPQQNRSDQTRREVPAAPRRLPEHQPVQQEEQTDTVAAPVATNTGQGGGGTPSVTPSPAPDSSSTIATMTAAQASTGGKSIVYPSQQIDGQTRDNLLILAAIAAATGGLLYTWSFFVPVSSARRPIPVRYIVPVQETVSR